MIAGAGWQPPMVVRCCGLDLRSRSGGYPNMSKTDPIAIPNAIHSA
jgi:hypothetical protein